MNVHCSVGFFNAVKNILGKFISPKLISALAQSRQTAVALGGMEGENVPLADETC